MKTIDQITYTGLFSKEHTSRMQPMSNEESELFLKLTMNEMQKGKGVPEKGSPEANLFGALLKTPTMRILTSRIEAPGITWEEVVSPAALMFIGCLNAIENPAQCVLWAYTMLYVRAREGKLVDMDVLAHAFPLGFPTPAYYSEVWDKQKGYELKIDNCDNFLDRREWWDDLVAIISPRTSLGRPQRRVDTSDLIEVDSPDDL